MPQYPIPYTNNSTLPTIELQNPVMQALIQFMSTHILNVVPLTHGIPAHMSLAWYNMNDAMFRTFKEAAPPLSGFKRDIHGVRGLFHILVKDALQTRNQKETASGIIIDALPLCGPVLATYNLERSGETTVYDDFLAYARQMLGVTTFLEHKIISGIKLLVAFEQYRAIVATLDGVCLELEVGNITIMSAKQTAKDLIAALKSVETLYGIYFQEVENGFSQADAITYVRFFTSMQRPTEFVFSPNLVMADLRASARNGTLHQVCCASPPPSFAEWDEITASKDEVCRFRQDIKQYKPDESVSLELKTNALKDWVTQMRTKVDEAIALPDAQ